MARTKRMKAGRPEFPGRGKEGVKPLYMLESSLTAKAGRLGEIGLDTALREGATS